MYLFWHELRRLARHGRLALGRVGLGLALLIVLATIFSVRFPIAEITDLSSTYIQDKRRISGFGSQLHFVINLVQLVLLVVATPAVCGGALTTERVRGTLDLLRMSEVSPVGIVLGKFAGRFVYVASYLVFCLPIAIAFELWGQVDPVLIASSFVIQLLTLAVLVALSLACTAETKSPAAGVALTYAVVGVIALALSLAPWMNPPAIFADWRRSNAVTYAGSLIAYASLSLPLTVIGLWTAASSVARDDDRPRSGIIPLSGSREAPPAELDPRLLAPIDARPWAFLYRPISSYLPQIATVRLFRPPRVADHPMIWKETYHGSNALAAELLRTVSLGVIIVEAIACAFLIVSLMHYSQIPLQISLQWNANFRVIVINALSVALLSCTAFAAGAVTQESEQNTLDSLLILPNGRRSVLASKWLGSILRVRWPLAAAILPLATGMMIVSFDSSRIVVLAIVLVVQLTFAATLGIICSVLISRTARSILVAVLLMAATGLLAVNWFNTYTGKLGGLAVQRASESVGFRLSPLATWQFLLSPVHISSRGFSVRILLESAGVYAGATAILAAFAVLIFVRRTKV
jgi:ABC-type transport system involved in multi-copper enzyme maturation permease subunit